MRPRCAFRTPPPPQFSRFLRLGNRHSALTLPPLASSLADATLLAPEGLPAVPAYPLSARQNSYHSPLANPTTPVVDVGGALCWDVPTENVRTATGCGLLPRKLNTSDDILRSLLPDAESITTDYPQTWAVQEGVSCTYRVNPLRGNRKHGESKFADEGLINIPMADQWTSADSGSDQGEPTVSPDPGTDPDRGQASNRSGLDARRSTNDTITLGHSVARTYRHALLALAQLAAALPALPSLLSRTTSADVGGPDGPRPGFAQQRTR